MRAVRRRTKKLIVAFHFQFANQAAWKCDTCRKSGLEKKRRCGFLKTDEAATTGVVWARRQAICRECPVSYISAESLALVEEYQAWKLFGSADYRVLPARLVEAICVLENEFRTEIQNAQE